MSAVYPGRGRIYRHHFPSETPQQHGHVIRPEPDRQAADTLVEAHAPVTTACGKRVTATIVRVAREDRRIVDAFAAFDRGERPTARRGLGGVRGAGAHAGGGFAFKFRLRGNST